MVPVRRRIALYAVLATKAALLAGPVTAGTRTTVPVLTGTTVVAGSRSAWTRVVLPKAVFFNPSEDVTLTGTGRLYGMVLKKEGAWNAPVGWRVHIGYCVGGGCASTYRDVRSEVFVPGGNTVTGTLPAGTYRLYVVADGAPVRATMKLRGLSGGTRTLQPGAPARAAVVEARPTIAEPGSGPLVYAAGSTRSVPAGGGMNVTVVWKDHPAKPAPSATGVCQYVGVEPPASGTTPAYHWPCQGGGPDLTGGLPAEPMPTPAGPGRYVSLFHTSFLLPENSYGFGGFSDTPGPVTSAHVQQLWLDF